MRRGTIEVICDGCNRESLEVEAEDVRWLDDEIIQAGWAITVEGDFCPECSEEKE